MVFENLAQDAAIIFTLFLLEAVLSFDNAAILAAMVRKLPRKDRKKALLYGLVGAYALRIGAILLASVLIQNPFLKILGGGYLLFLAVKHFIELARHRHAAGHSTVVSEPFLVRLGVPMLVATIIQIELVDLAFAIDQVIVAVAFTDKISLIVIAAMVGILFLRLGAAVLSRVMDWLPLLEHMAYIAVGWVGIKLILLYRDIHVATWLSVGFTLSLFGVPILLKLVFKIPKSRPHQEEDAVAADPHAMVEAVDEDAKGPE